MLIANLRKDVTSKIFSLAKEIPPKEEYSSVPENYISEVSSTASYIKGIIISTSETIESDIHKHYYDEYVVVVAGEITINNSHSSIKLKEKEIYIISKEDPHYTVISPGSIILTLWIDNQYLNT